MDVMNFCRDSIIKVIVIVIVIVIVKLSLISIKNGCGSRLPTGAQH